MNVYVYEFHLWTLPNQAKKATKDSATQDEMLEQSELGGGGGGGGGP
jgi:hypothetical protein